MIKKLRAILHILVIALFMSYFWGATTFTHTHISESGETRTHSHPYSSTSHQHSEASFQLIASLAFFAIAVVLTMAVAPLKISSFSYQIANDFKRYISPYNHSRSRAPPVQFYL